MSTGILMNMQYIQYIYTTKDEGGTGIYRSKTSVNYQMYLKISKRNEGIKMICCKVFKRHEVKTEQKYIQCQKCVIPSEKDFYKNQYPLMMKVTKRLKIERI